MFILLYPILPTLFSFIVHEYNMKEMKYIKDQEYSEMLRLTYNLQPRRGRIEAVNMHKLSCRKLQWKNGTQSKKMCGKCYFIIIKLCFLQWSM